MVCLPSTVPSTVIATFRRKSQSCSRCNSEAETKRRESPELLAQWPRNGADEELVAGAVSPLTRCSRGPERAGPLIITGCEDHISIWEVRGPKSEHAGRRYRRARFGNACLHAGISQRQFGGAPPLLRHVKSTLLAKTRTINKLFRVKHLPRHQNTS